MKSGQGIEMDFRVKLLVSMIESLGIGGENDYTTSTFRGVQQEWSKVWGLGQVYSVSKGWG